MTPDRWERIQFLFFAASYLDPIARTAFLTDACTDDPSLGREVEELLRAEGHTGTAWEASISNAIAAAASEFVGDPAPCEGEPILPDDERDPAA